MGDGVAVQVGLGVGHRIEVAHLARQVEHGVGTAHHVGHAFVADVGAQQVDRAGDAVEVAQIASVTGHAGVDHSHRRTGRGEQVHQVRADEPQATGHHTGGAGKSFAQRRARCGGPVDPHD